MGSDTGTLIIGSDSVMGGALMTALRRSGQKVVGTTRRRGLRDGHCLYLDLSVDAGIWRCPVPVSAAIVCAGATSIDDCRKNPAATASINVKAVSALVKHLVESGVFVIYLSSSQVFDGRSPYRLPADPVSPVTEYGRQKAEVEKNISRWGDSVSIVRFTKVLSSGNRLFSGWTDSLLNDRVIRPFSDVFISPVPLYFAVSVLDFVRVNHLKGILQVSGGIDISYADAAYRGAQVLGRDPSLVQPVLSSGSGACAETLPRHSAMDTTRLRSVLGNELPDVWRTIENMFAEPGALDEPIEARTIGSR